MAFIRYVKPVRDKDSPGITIYKNGMIGFNAAASRLCQLHEYDYCVLYFDPEARKIAFTFGVDPQEEGARRLCVVGGMKQVRAMGFLHTFGIPVPDKAQRYKAAQQDGMLVVAVASEGEG